MNELEIKTYLERNDYEALGRIADGLMFDHHMSVAEVFDLFERLGGDRAELEEAFLGTPVADRIAHDSARNDSADLQHGRA